MSDKRIKVRIPYIITQDGKWCAYGYTEASDDPDWLMIEEMVSPEANLGPHTRGWITVELPLPEEAEVIGDAANVR